MWLTLQSKPALYERDKDSDWPALEEGRDQGYLPGHPAVLRGVEYHGDPAQVRRGGRGADSSARRARGRRPEDSWVFSRARRQEILSFRSSELPSLQHLRPSSVPSEGTVHRTL